MKFNLSDKIDSSGNIVKHESAGGFVFYESPQKKLFVALVKKPDDGYYIPKGHVKHGEKSEAAALREVVEELSLKVYPKLLGKLGVDSYSFTLPNDKREHFKKVHLFIFTLNKKAKITPLEEESFTEAKWFIYKKALGMLVFDVKNLIKAKKVYFAKKKDEEKKNKK